MKEKKAYVFNKILDKLLNIFNSYLLTQNDLVNRFVKCIAKAAL